MINLDKELDKEKLQLIGQVLIERGFKDWFLFFFKAIEKTDFIIEPIHNKLFSLFDEVIQLKKNRVNINIFPRAGKTTLLVYYVAYSLAIQPKAQFIYTSFNQDLLRENANRLGSILKSKIYQDMYGSEIDFEDQEEVPEDNFWEKYLSSENKEFKVSARKITNKSGGIIVFNSVGSTITGFGFGLRNYDKFGGSLLVDDGNKPSDTFFYKKARQKTFDYFRHILLTRANNSKAPIINVQQRLHLDDLTGFLQREYNYYTLSIPLVNEDGTCNAPSQYTKERIEELKKDNYLFLTQYQQTPIVLGGQVIRTEWFKNYITLPKFKVVYITADTAFMTKQSSDFSVFQLWGKTDFANSDYYLIDMIRGKWESPELLQRLTDFYNKYRKKFTITQLYIENKASGIGLIQQIKRLKIPVKEVNPTKDKFKRLSDVLPIIESGYVYIPEQASWRMDFINECEEFRRDMTHKHDDIVDCATISLGIDVIKPLSIYDYLY